MWIQVCSHICRKSSLLLTSVWPYHNLSEFIYSFPYWWRFTLLYIFTATNHLPWTYSCLLSSCTKCAGPASDDHESRWCTSFLLCLQWCNVSSLNVSIYIMGNGKPTNQTHNSLPNRKDSLPAQHWVYTSRGGIAKYSGVLVSVSSGCNQRFCATIYFHQTVYESIASKISLPRLDIARYVICAYMINKNWPPITGFICIFSLASEVEYIFIYIVNIWISLPFNCFAHL